MKMTKVEAQRKCFKLVDTRIMENINKALKIAFDYDIWMMVDPDEGVIYIEDEYIRVNWSEL